MMYSKDTPLVLTDETEDQIQLGIRTVNAAQNVDQLVPPMKNELKIMVDNQLSDLEKNYNRYYTCLKRSVTT